MGRRRGSRGSLEGLWVRADKAVEYMYTKCLFDQVDIGPYHRGRRGLSEPQRVTLVLGAVQTMTYFNDDVFLFSDLFKRHRNNFSVIDFPSTQHVSALALFTCDIQLKSKQPKGKV